MSIAMLDVADIAPAARVNAVESVLDAAWVSSVRFDNPPEDVEFTFQVARLGPVTITRTTSNGVSVALLPPADVRDEAPAMALNLHDGAASQLIQAGRRTQLSAGVSSITDLTRPYEFGWAGQARSDCAVLDLGFAGLSVDDVRLAQEAPVLETPLGLLVLNHVRYVVDNIDELTATEIDRDVTARTTADLLRALVSQVANDTVRRDAAHETELSQVLAFVRLHLRDAELTPQSIAAAHFISERHLYRLCARSGISLADWIMKERLEAIRRELSDPANLHRPLESVAFAWGFRSGAHFSRRFKAQYGVSPSDWRRLHVAFRPSGSTV